MGKKKANQLGRSLIKDRLNTGNRRKVDNDTMVRPEIKRPRISSNFFLLFSFTQPKSKMDTTGAG